MVEEIITTMDFIPYKSYNKKWRIILLVLHALFIIMFFTGIVLNQYYKYNYKNFYANFFVIGGIVIAIVYSILKLFVRKNQN